MVEAVLVYSRLLFISLTSLENITTSEYVKSL